jgi:hypothetical protein
LWRDTVSIFFSGKSKVESREQLFNHFSCFLSY